MMFLKLRLFRQKLTIISCFLLLLPFSLAHASEAGFPGRNVNVIGPPPSGSGAIPDTGLRQQNEPSCAVNPTNPSQICCGFNDYRGIDIPEIGDAWEGLSCSRDGGQSWNSQLIPGHRGDPEYSLNLDFAADPNLVSAPGGLFYNFIASDRNHIGGIYIQRFAWKNKEDGWPLIQVGGPILINKGTSGRFIDKPHMIGFLDDDNNEKVTMTWSNGEGSGSQNVPAGDLGMAAAVFVGNDNNDGTKILYWNSKDWGETWDNPTKLTESKGVNSGVNLAANGDNICATWRRFDDTNESSSILYACSSDRGKRFGKPKVIYESMCPFDQVTLNGVAPAPKDIVSFRTNAFPVIAGDGDKFYVFWSDRGFAEASNGPVGCELRTEAGEFNPSYGRIVYSVTGNNGKSWSNPQPVDDTPIGGNALIGHQFMPAAFGANGEVIISWIDNRDDVANVLDVDKQLIVDFWKEGNALYRHTTDIRSSRLIAGGNTTFTPSVKISNYTKALFPLGGVLQLRQMEFNLVNARLFQKGTAPFIGDYLSVTANAYNRSENGEWVNSSTHPIPGSPTFHISWGDNRDVRGNAWGDADGDGFSAPSPYTPTTSNSVNASLGDGEQIKNSTPSVEDPPDNQQQQCVPNSGVVTADRTRDQNIYSAPLYPLATMQSPGAIKVTGQVQRALPLYITNNSFEQKYFQLEITAQPDDFTSCVNDLRVGSASFRQDPVGCLADASTTIQVNVSAKSSAVRTVFITSTDTLPNIPVELSTCVDDAGQLICGANIVSTVVLNNDPLDFGSNLEQPDYTFEDILTRELHNPDLLNPDLLNPDLLNLLLENPDLLNELLNLGLINVDLLNPDLMNLLIENPDLLNPDLLNPDLMNLIIANTDLLNVIVLNPDLLNPDLINLIIENPDLMNPDLLNSDLLNILVSNPDLLNPDLLNLIVANPDLLNPDLLNVLVENPDLLNPDLLNIELSNPDLMNPDLLNPDLLNTSLYNIVVENPDLMNPDLMNPDLLNPDLLNPDLLNLIVLNPDLLNPDLLNPDLLNPDLLNPDLLNPDLLNLLVQNPDLLNPDLLNPDLLNPDLMNPDLLNPDLINGALSYADVENPDITNPEQEENIGGMYIDVTWQVKNDGNTTTGYMAQPYIAGPEEHTATQLIVSKPYLRQTTRNCIPVIESDNQVVVNIYNPVNQAPIINPNPEDSAVHGLASYWLAPGEIANVTLRIFGTSASQLHADRVGLYVNSEACNTGETICNSQPSAETAREFDNKGPVITPLSVVMAVTTVEATSPLGGVIEFVTPTATDNGESVPVTCTYESGSRLLIGDYTDENANVCTAVDAIGNESETEPFEFSIEDTTAPVFTTVPEPVINAEASEPGGAVVTYLVVAEDIVDLNVTITCSQGSGELFALADTLVTCDATDDETNTASISFNVVVKDTTKPKFTVVPVDVVAEATGFDGAIVTFSIEAEDAVDQGVTITCTKSSGSTFLLGTTSVSCEAKDVSGNSASTIFDVVVEDKSPPYFTVKPGNLVVEADGPDGSIVNFSMEAMDLADDVVVINCSVEPGNEVVKSGDLFAIGTTVVTCEAKDDSTNSASIIFNVTVEDTASPFFTVLPVDIVVEATGPEGAIANYSVAAGDNVDQEVSIVCSTNSGETFVNSGEIYSLGTTAIECEASDDAGNSSLVNFVVTVQDTKLPFFTPVPADISTEATGPGGAVVNFTVAAEDVVDQAVVVTCLSNSGDTFVLGTTTVSCEAEDDKGNKAFTSFKVIVNDNTAPQFIPVPSDVTVEATGFSNTTLIFNVEAVDVVDLGNVTINCIPPSGGEFVLGMTSVTCIAMDSAGNTSSTTFEIDVVDKTAPIMLITGAIVVEATSSAGAHVLNTYPLMISDIVDSAPVLSCTHALPGEFPLGRTTVTCTVTDFRGNSASVFFDVTVTDTTPPVLTVPQSFTEETLSPEGNIVAYINDGEHDYQVFATDLVSSSDLIAIVCKPPSESLFAITVTTVNCIATDGAGNSSNDLFEVSIVDTTAPEIFVPADFRVPAESEAGSIVEYVVTASDAGDEDVDISCTSNSGSTFNIGTTVVECTATDDAGLFTKGTFNVTVRTDIIWIEPVDDPASGNLGANMNFRWGYGAGGVLSNSSSMIDKPGGKGTEPLIMKFFGETCETGIPQVIDLDAGRSSLRYSSGEWQLNWQTGQSTIDVQPITAGCYELSIPRAADSEDVDKKQVILN